MNSLQTDRLVLRRFEESDAEPLFAYLKAPTASCFFSLKLTDLTAAREEAAKRSQGDEFIAVCLKGSGQLIGDLFAHLDPQRPEGEGESPDTASVGWNFNPSFGGQGYALEAARALCADLFANQGMRRLYSYVEDHNTPSRRLCEKLGMREEGVLIEYVTFQADADGHPIYENTIQYAILRREWDRLNAA